MKNKPPIRNGKTPQQFIEEKLKTARPLGILIGGYKPTDNLMDKLEMGNDNIAEIRSSLNFDYEITRILLPMLTKKELQGFIDVKSSLSEALEEKYAMYLNINNLDKITPAIALQSLKDSREAQIARHLQQQTREHLISRK